MTKVIEMIVRMIVIVALAVYSGFITTKYIEAKKEAKMWKAKYESIMFVPDFSEPKGKIYETRIDTHYIIKWKTKKEVVKDTFWVYSVEPQRLSDTLKLGYNWVWKNFLAVRDTYFLYQDTSFKFQLSIHRYWQIKNPLEVYITFYDKKPFEWWWRGYIAPAEFEGLIIRGFEDVRKWNFSVGAGVMYGFDRFNPYFSGLLSYKRHQFGFLLGDDIYGIDYKLRIY